MLLLGFQRIDDCCAYHLKNEKTIKSLCTQIYVIVFIYTVRGREG